jgi:hypothetical protein
METTAHFSCCVIIRPFCLSSSPPGEMYCVRLPFHLIIGRYVTVSHRIPLGIKGCQAQRVVCFDFLVPFLIGRNWITLDSRNDSLGKAEISFSYLDKMFSLFLVLASFLLSTSSRVSGETRKPSNRMRDPRPGPARPPPDVRRRQQQTRRMATSRERW